jgi:DNA-binding NtrC family response regulator
MKRNQQGQPHLTGCRVLVVEDEYFLATDLSQTLRAGGAEVIGPIFDLQSARDQVAKDGFDVAVIDLNLFDHAAYVIADELLRTNIPFVFATGYSQEVIPARFRDIRRWEKPYDVDKLVEDVGRLCSLAAHSNPRSPVIGIECAISTRSPPTKPLLSRSSE